MNNEKNSIFSSIFDRTFFKFFFAFLMIVAIFLGITLVAEKYQEEATASAFPVYNPGQSSVQK
ncbi:MAG: hypothetical protein WCP15_01395 [bacterium]